MKWVQRFLGCMGVNKRNNPENTPLILAAEQSRMDRVEESPQKIAHGNAQAGSIDYLQMVEAVTGSHMSGQDAMNRIVRPLSQNNHAEARAEIAQAAQGVDLERARASLSGMSRDRAGRACNLLFELVENAVLAVSNTDDAEVRIDVSGRRLTVQDNGPGMTASAVFDALLIPGHSGWFKYGLLQKGQTYDREGMGFTLALLWGRRISVDTCVKGGGRTVLHFVVDEAHDISFSSWVESGYGGRIGTTVTIELRDPLPRTYSTGPASKIYLWQHGDDIDNALRWLVHSYCAFVNPRIRVFLDGRTVNQGNVPGDGPQVVRLVLADHLSCNVGIPFFTATISDTEGHPDHYTGRNHGFQWIVEFYQNGLFLFFDYLPDANSLSCLYTEKINGLSDFQKTRLNDRIMRVFLPAAFPLLIGRLGLPAMAEARIIELIVDKVKP